MAATRPDHDALRTDWLLVLLLFAAGLLASGQFAKISFTLGALGEAFPGREAALPWVISALSLMGIAFGATAGVIVARLGVRAVLLTGLLAGAVLSAVQALLPAFPLFLALRLAEGAAHLAIVVSAPTLMAAVASGRDRPLVMGLWGTFFGVGFALYALAVPPLVARFGVGGVYLAHALALLALAAALGPRLPPAAVRSEPAAGFLARHLAIYSTPRTIAPALGFLCHTLMFLALLTFLPRFLGDWTAPILPLAALIGTLGAGALAAVVAPKRILYAGFALTIAGVALLIAVPEAARVWVALPLLAVIGLAPGASFAAIPALNPYGADQARANGALAQLGNVGTALSAPLFALLLGAGLAGLAGAVAAISLAGIVIVWIIHRKIAASG